MKKIIQTLQSKWYEYLIEIIVIIIGILLAFALNSWNQERKDRSLERYYLQALKKEFIANQKGSNYYKKFHEVQLKNANLVLNVLTEDTIVTNLEELHVALLHTGWATNHTFVNNVWSELVSTGKVGLIKNNHIREAIAEFHRRAEISIKLESEWSTFNINYRNKTNGILPPQLRLATGEILGFYQVRGNINGDLLTQKEIARRLQQVENLGGLISDIIIVRTAGLGTMKLIFNKTNEIIELLEKELEDKS